MEDQKKLTVAEVQARFVRHQQYVQSPEYKKKAELIQKAWAALCDIDWGYPDTHGVHRSGKNEAAEGRSFRVCEGRRIPGESPHLLGKVITA